jgi:hypothetical protein
MNIFTADPRDAFISDNGCNTCGCCGQAQARPGETNKFMVNYAAWALPLGGRGLTDRVDFSIERKEQSPDSRAPINTNKFFSTPFNTALTDVLTVGASDPLEGELVYSSADLFPPQFGEVVINADGSFTYTPTLGFTGYDKFYYVTKNEAKQIVNQVIVGVQPNGSADPMPAKAFDEALSVVQKSVHVDGRGYVLSFALKASPIAVVGEIYRLNIRQHAIDCDCQEYTHISCYDITIVNC